jgi:death-on-curing protein
MDDALIVVYTLAEELYDQRGEQMPAFQFLGEEGKWRLDGALALPSHGYYPDDCSATAAMFVALVKDHPFQDGNKRYAIVATTVFLMLNEFICLVSAEEWERMALAVAASEAGMEEVTTLLRARTKHVSLETDVAWVNQLVADVGVPGLRETIAAITGMARQMSSIIRRRTERPAGN